MNKMLMYLKLEEWITTSSVQKGITLADSLWDSPFQTSEYSPYVVMALLKGIPKKHIPCFVMDTLRQELVAAHAFIPPKKKWYQLW